MELLASVPWLACMHPQLPGLDHVFTAISQCLDVSTLFSLPHAAATGKISLFQRVLKRVDLTDNLNQILRYHWISQSLQKAIEGGHLAMVKYIHEVHPAPLAVSSLRVALRYGQLEIVEWLSDHRADQLCVDTPPTLAGVSSVRCCILARCMHPLNVTRDVATSRWMFEANCITSLSLVGDIAAATSELEMVEWIHRQGFPMAFTPEAMTSAVRRGDLGIVRFLHQQGYAAITSDDLLAIAIGSGHAQVAEYLQQHKICRSITPEVLVRIATERGRLDVLEEYLAGCNSQVARELGRYIPQIAAQYGHLPVLQWAHEHELGELTWNVVGAAAASGSLEMVQWLHVHCPKLFPQSRAIENASWRGHLSIVQWLHENTATKCTKAAMDGAARSGHLAVVKWLHENRTEGCTIAAMSAAVCNGDLEMVAWFHENRPDRCTKVAMKEALRKGHLELVMWLHEHGYNGITQDCMQIASPTVAMWLHETLGFPIGLSTVAKAVSTNNLTFLQWIHARATAPVIPPRTWRKCYPHTRIIEWMEANGLARGREGGRRTRRRLQY